MAGSLRLLGGKKAGLPQLADREPAWCSDTGELYIGSPAGNRLAASERAVAGIYDRLTLTPGAVLEEGQIGRNADGDLVCMQEGALKKYAFRPEELTALGAEATLAEVIAALNGLMEGLKGV